MWEGYVEEELIFKIPMKTEDRAKTVFIKSAIADFFRVDGVKTKMVILTLVRVCDKRITIFKYKITANIRVDFTDTHAKKY